MRSVQVAKLPLLMTVWVSWFYDCSTDQTEDRRLLDEIEYFKSKTIALEEELAKVRMEREKVIDQKEEASKRHDTIVMQLSGTINDAQFQLQEARKLNFIQRIFNFF